MRRCRRGIATGLPAKVLAGYLVAATTLLGAVPREAAAALVPTTLATAEQATGRTEDLARLQSLLERKVVQQRLADLGFSAEEIRARLEALDDARLHELAQRVDGLVPAGDGVGVVVALAVIVLV
ncbi:MAG TPA: PA2779 family protein, partial [Candidatus Methylomirabilis sp.]|nr:PA2779 family protein [Candidatus Methylomirabilis sp.]